MFAGFYAAALCRRPCGAGFFFCHAATSAAHILKKQGGSKKLNAGSGADFASLFCMAAANTQVREIWRPPKITLDGRKDDNAAQDVPHFVLYLAERHSMQNLGANIPIMCYTYKTPDAAQEQMITEERGNALWNSF